MENDSERNFLEKHNITVINQKRGYRYRYDRYFNVPTDANAVVPPYYKYHEEFTTSFNNYERIMVVEIPETTLTRLKRLDDHFSERIGNFAAETALTILDRDANAKDIRDKNPAVQAAWEQYSFLLHLASNGKPLP